MIWEEVKNISVGELVEVEGLMDMRMIVEGTAGVGYLVES